MCIRDRFYTLRILVWRHFTVGVEIRENRFTNRNSLRNCFRTYVYMNFFLFLAIESGLERLPCNFESLYITCPIYWLWFWLQYVVKVRRLPSAIPTIPVAGYLHFSKYPDSTYYLWVCNTRGVKTNITPHPTELINDYLCPRSDLMRISTELICYHLLN